MMVQSKKLEERSLVDRLVDVIRDAIIAGELEPGAHIGVGKLAHAYGVSMIPVREALARMLGSRIVRVETNRGYFVADKPTPEEFRQFVEARELFELAAVKLGFANKTADDIRALTGLNDKMADIANAGEPTRIVEWGNLNAAFHQVLVGLARNNYLNYQYETMALGQLHYQMLMKYPQTFPRLTLLVAQHGEMIDALVRNDKKRLLSVLSGHIHNVTLTG